MLGDIIYILREVKKKKFPRSTSHSYFLKYCPDTKKTFRGFKLHYKQEIIKH